MLLLLIYSWRVKWRVSFYILSYTANAVIQEVFAGLFWLTQCNDDIQSHLAALHLSRELLTKKSLILARVGTFDLDDSAIKAMKICARHRHNLGKFWRPSTACLYLKHEGGPGRKSSKTRYSVSLDMSKKIQRIFGVFVPVGSGRKSITI